MSYVLEHSSAEGKLMTPVSAARAPLIAGRRDRSRPLHVCHLVKSLGRGGAETLLVSTLRVADDDRARYSYAYLVPWKDALVPELCAEGAEVSCLANGHALGMLPAVRAVASHIQRSGIDILHCHLPIAGVVGRLAGRIAGVPVVYTEHNRLERYHPLTRRLHTATWSLQRDAVAVSDSVRDSVRKHVGDGARVRVIRNGVDTQAFSPPDCMIKARQRLSLGDGPVIGTVAVFREAKRLDIWLEAAAQVRAVHPTARFVIVGDGPLRDMVVKQVQRYGLEQCVVLPGLHADVRPYLSAMDVFAMSSSVEGLPVALLEAMSMGRPVVATSVGGIPEVISDGVNGRLVGEVSAQPIASAIHSLLVSADERTRLGLAARETIETSFSVASMARSLEDLYAEVVFG